MLWMETYWNDFDGPLRCVDGTRLVSICTGEVQMDNVVEWKITRSLEWISGVDRYCKVVYGTVVLNVDSRIVKMDTHVL